MIPLKSWKMEVDVRFAFGPKATEAAACYGLLSVTDFLQEIFLAVYLVRCEQVRLDDSKNEIGEDWRLGTQRRINFNT